MRVKYNERKTYNESSSYVGKSNIFLKYSNYIDDLLTPTIDSYRKYTYDDLYVEHSLCNDFKKYKNKRAIDDFLYVTGLTGNGKTSLLKYVFRYIENTYVIENNNMLVLPFTCDNLVGEVSQLKKRLADLFFGITRKICKKYNLKEYWKFKDEFRDYVENRRIQFSCNLKGWDEISAEILLDQLYESYPLELALLAFKFTMGQEENPIENFIFIIDDVESVGINMEVFPIYLANKVRECLDNRSQEEKGKWCCTVIVACRHYVSRILLTKKNYFYADDKLLREAGINRSTMESFGGNEIDIGNGPTMKEIIEKRRKTIEANLNEEEKAEFAEICLVLNSIINHAGDLLLSLNLNDYRTTFFQLKSLIFNKRWLQRYDSESGAFKIGTAEDNFYRNKPNIIRAIALGENDVYYGNKSIIPNLLENESDRGDLWKLIIMQLLVNDVNKDWSNSIDLEMLKKKLKKIFEDKEEYFNEANKAIIFFIENRLLLRGKKEEQHDSADLRHIDAKNAKYVYPSNAIKILWDNLADNSVLFELFVDDIWIEEPYRKNRFEYGKKFLQFNLYNYKECVHYLNFLINVECKIRIFLKNRDNIEEYIGLFGKQPITKQLYLGLWNSYNAYFKDKYSGEESEKNRLEQQLFELEEKIKYCSSLFED